VSPSPALPRALLLACVAALCAIPASEAHGQLRPTLIASGFDRPLGMVPFPGRPGTFLVFEQAGRVRVLQSGVIAATPFLDLRSDIASGGEQGLLGLAFAPDFTTSGRLFLSFTNRSGDSVIARFTRSSADPLVGDASSRFDLRWPAGERVIRQPFTNHNGGQIAFGSDGYLYVGLGDGGSANDPMNLAQDPSSLLGKMLRLDVAVADGHANGYQVPPTNPFVGRPGVLPEIWAFGLRNPWRWSFDDTRLGGTGALVIGDVGQSQREEINYEPRARGGRNYGWSQREGLLPNVTNRTPFSPTFSDPIWDYPRDAGRSVTGGYVYRGRALGAAFVGRYFFADFVTSRVWSLALVIDATTREARAEGLVDHTAELGAAAASPASFAVDADGELYLLGYGGSLYRIDGTDVPPAPMPTIEPRRPHTAAPVGVARPRR
jgi:glucose/arabinose dehydrogenase